MTGVSVAGDNNSFDLLRGALVLDTEDRGWGEDRHLEDGYDVVQDGFWVIRTDRGYIDIEVRNSHNGYYGGSLLEVDTASHPISDIADLHQIFEDF